jgi:hypothetical protein
MTIKPKNLILIEAPFQLLCAIEFIKANNEFHYYIVFVETSSSGNTAQVTELVDFFEKENAGEELFVFKKISRCFFPIFILKLFYKSLEFRKSQYRKIIIGDYRSSFMRIIESRLPQECVVLDDGIALLNTYESIRLKEVALFTNSLGNKVLSRLIKKVKKVYSVYSMIPDSFLEQNLRNDNPLIYQPNSFTYLKSFLQTKLTMINSSELIIVIGNPLIELEMLTEVVFKKCLRELQIKYKGQDVIYIAHRRDSPEKLDMLVSDLGIEVLKLKKSLEVELILGNLPAGIFFTFSSAALYTISMFSKDSDCFYFNLASDMVPKEHLKSYKKIYKLFDCTAKKFYID